MDSPILVRPAGRLDVPGILEIYNHAVVNTTATADYEPQTLEAREGWYKARVAAGYPVFVAEDEASNAIVGWSCLNPYHARIGYRFTAETSIYVAETARGMGLGRRLLAALVAAAPTCGVHTLIASIDGTNEASLRLHEAQGFVLAGHLKEIIFKFGRWLDVIYMQRILPEGERRDGPA